MKLAKYLFVRKHLHLKDHLQLFVLFISKPGTLLLRGVVGHIARHCDLPRISVLFSHILLPRSQLQVHRIVQVAERVEVEVP